MRKLFLASALIAVAGITLYSCSNGAYDAHPDTDYNAAQNHIDADSGEVQVYLGSMEATVNNKRLNFAPAFYFIDTNGFYNLIARVIDDTVFHRTLRIQFTVFEGPRMYDVNAGTPTPIVNFVMLDTSRVDLAGRKIYKTYTANTNESVGYAGINIEGEEGGNLRGSFYGKMYRVMPEKQYQDTIRFDYSPFYFEKVPFPVPDEYAEYLYN